MTHSPSSSARRVLLIEDDPACADILMAALRVAGIACEHVTTCAAARASFERTPPDVVIADIQVPDGNAFEAAAALRQRSGVPVIVITGDPTLQATLAALQARVFAFLVKPFDVRHFQATVKRALEARHVQASLAAQLARVQQWQAELAAFEASLEAGEPEDAGAAILALTARQAMEGMADLRIQIAGLVARGDEATAAARAAVQGTRPLALLEAVRETITVLERTKDAFRSRELGELRQRLSQLLALSKSC